MCYGVCVCVLAAGRGLGYLGVFFKNYFVFSVLFIYILQVI